VTWVKLRPRAGGAHFYWFNTHFDAFSPWARTQSSELLRDQIDYIAGAMPCIVTGDFNSGPNSTPYRMLISPQSTATSSLHDVFRDVHPIAARDEGTVHFFTGWRGGPRIDWILASAHFHTIDAQIDHTRGPDGYPSDHFAVIATLHGPAATRSPPHGTRRE
jgi:endonuclease/exonuclease/phosphatase family metal-dependent hydrolase